MRSVSQSISQWTRTWNKIIDLPMDGTERNSNEFWNLNSFYYKNNCSYKCSLYDHFLTPTPAHWPTIYSRRSPPLTHFIILFTISCSSPCSVPYTLYISNLNIYVLYYSYLVACLPIYEPVKRRAFHRSSLPPRLPLGGPKLLVIIATWARSFTVVHRHSRQSISRPDFLSHSLSFFAAHQLSCRPA